jgi:hypothetical protein
MVFALHNKTTLTSGCRRLRISGFRLANVGRVLLVRNASIVIPESGATTGINCSAGSCDQTSLFLHHRPGTLGRFL